MAYMADIFNVFHFEVTVTSNDILRIEIKRSSTSVLIDVTLFLKNYKKSPLAKNKRAF
jgi:hypothetical protein